MRFRKMAPEIVSTKEQWINSDVLTLAKLKGNLVLLDFFAYSCVNCIRTFPALREMWKKYRGKNVVIIGIHTPEFGFEKDIRNVTLAIERHGLTYPILSDPECINWKNYGNKYWPRSALIGAKGELIFEHVGEAGYDEIDKRIVEELKVKSEHIREKKRHYLPEMSPEIYAGSLRNAGLGSRMVCTPKSAPEENSGMPKNICVYFDPGEHARDIIYLSGQWKQEQEYVEFEAEANGGGYCRLKYYASEVNLVMDGKGAAEVLLDERPVEKEEAGHTVSFRDGRSYVRVSGANMYGIIKSGVFKHGELKIVPFKGLRVYAWTFG